MKQERTETEYKRLYQETQKILQDLKLALRELPPEDSRQWDGRLAGLESDTHTPLKLAVAGEYNVGKSTLIKAVTGAEVAISADVTTNQITSYKLDDISLIDMPGTLSGMDKHDDMAMEAVLNSDLLLFVVTNELFNAQSIEYFKKAVQEFRKAKQCMLVVNQFDRVNLRDRTPEEAIAVMTEALEPMVKPISVYDLRPVFISARDYCDAMKQTDPRLKTELERSSRMDSL